jgi:hypothetical protein
MYEKFDGFLLKVQRVFNFTQPTTFQTITDLFGTLQTQKYLGHKLPSSFTEQDYNSMELLRSWHDYFRYAGKLNNIFASNMISRMIDNFDGRIQNITTQRLKWTFLNVHDSHIVNFASVLNITSDLCVESILINGSIQELNCETHTGFVSNIIVELRSDDQNYFYVMVRF